MTEENSARWPTRTSLCARCRKAICDNDACGCAQPERVPFGDSQARHQLAIQVWRDGADHLVPQVALHEQEPPATAWLMVVGAITALGSGTMFGQAWLMASSILFLLAFIFIMQRAENKRLSGQRRIARPPGFTPIGAAREPAQLIGASAIVGIVQDGPTTLSPIGRVPCMAFTVELRNQAAETSTLLLRDGATTGLYITTDDQQTVWIAPGALDIVNGLQPADDFGARLYLARLDPLSESDTGPDPFPFEQAFEAVLQAGTRVRIHNPIQLSAHAPASGEAQTSGYRESPGNMLMPRGLPRIEIVPSVSESSNPT